MSIEQWLAFAAASTVLLAIPGPTVLLVVSYALSHGRRAARASVAGVALGDFTAMTASIVGVGALLAASATLFMILKWLGAAYLVWLGIKLWRAPLAGKADGDTPESGPPAAANLRRIFLHTYVVTALNPKSIVFFVAFLPQFIDPDRAFLPQIAIAEATFLVLATANACLYALLASGARRTVRRDDVRLLLNRVGGSLMIAAGLGAALSRRGSGA